MHIRTPYFIVNLQLKIGNYHTINLPTNISIFVLHSDQRLDLTFQDTHLITAIPSSQAYR
jgi:hypothetical protein